MPIPARGDIAGRLTKLASIPLATLVLVACGAQANNNQTGDSAFPSLISASGFPHEVVTVEGARSAALYLPVFLVAAAIFVLVEGLLIFTALRFRRRSADGKDGEFPAQTHGNNRLEVLWTAIPALIVLVMFVGSTDGARRVEDASRTSPRVVVDVLAFRFGWKFTYKDAASYDEATATYQHRRRPDVQPASPSSTEPRDPARTSSCRSDEPVRFRLNAADVIHSFYVPAFFFKRDVIPGRTNEFEVTIEKPGRYGGQCAEFCGLDHTDMYFTVRAVELPEYEAWLADMRAGGPSHDGAAPPPAADAAGGPPASPEVGHEGMTESEEGA